VIGGVSPDPGSLSIKFDQYMPPILSFHLYLINRPSQHLKLTITKTVCKGDCSLIKFAVLTCLASVGQSRL
jgi:hypothetical protein